MADIVFLNQLSLLRNDPTYKNLLDLAKTDPEQAAEEINDYAIAAMPPTVPPEMVSSWLIAYLHGICTAMVLSSYKEALEQLESRIDHHFSGGNWQFRKPYTSIYTKSQLNETLDTSPPEPPTPIDQGPKNAG